MINLEFDMKHFRLGRDEVTCEERDAIQILEQERGRWEHDEYERREQERQMETAVGQIRQRGR